MKVISCMDLWLDLSAYVTHMLCEAHLGVYYCNNHNDKMYNESDLLWYSIVHVENIIVVIIKLYSRTCL